MNSEFESRAVHMKDRDDKELKINDYVIYGGNIWQVRGFKNSKVEIHRYAEMLLVRPSLVQKY